MKLEAQVKSPRDTEGMSQNLSSRRFELVSRASSFLSVDEQSVGHISALLMCAVLTLFTQGCSNVGTVKNVDPVKIAWTTYPYDKVTQITQRIPLLPVASIPIELKSVSRKIEELGDTAEEEIYIIPRSQADSSEEILLKRIGEGGREVCGDEFRISESMFFYGDEEALKFLSITTPALRVLYRCSLGNFQDQRLDKINDISQVFEDWKFFDVTAKEILLSPEQTTTEFKNFIMQKNMPVVDSGKSGDEFFVLAGRPPTEMRWGRIERIAAVIHAFEGHSMLIVRHFSYQLTYHKRALEPTGSGFPWGPQPWDRKVAYARSLDFINEFDRSLTSYR